MKHNYRAVIALAFVWISLAISATPASAQLKITYPTDDSRVSGKVVELKGVGADPKAQLEVTVLTDEWYLQRGRATVNADGTWSYSPCYLSGQGEYNNHTVKVTLIRDGKRGPSATVRGVVRRD